jgi:Mce-associated membrane protein
MADTNERPTDSAMTKADAMALAEQADAEAAEAEALAAAARARARAIRLRREAEAQAAAEEPDAPTAEAAPITDTSDGATETRKVTETAESDESGEVTETGESDATGAPPTLEPEVAPRRRRLRMPRLSTSAKAAAIIVICGLLAVSGYMLWHHRDVTEQRQRAAAFAAGARQGVIDLISLDFKKAKQDVQRVLDSSTGEFKDDFQQRAADFTSVVEQSKVVTEGKVNSAAVESMDKNSAVVLVSATSRVTNSVGAKQEPRAWRLRITMSDDAGQMKMSKVEFAP